MTGRIFITGDKHGTFTPLFGLAEKNELLESDILIIAGDAGYVWKDDYKYTVESLEQVFPGTVAFIDGNHENHAVLNRTEISLWNGGRVHRIRPNVLHLMRGQDFAIDGTSIFTMGGGYSIDAAMRIPGRSWWPEEMPSDDEYAEAWTNLAAHGNKVDVIVSHAAPEETMQMFVQTGEISHRFLQEGRLNVFLENVRQTVEHRHYYFGHMHLDKRLFRNQTALFYDVYRLVDGRKAMRRDTVGELSAETDRGEPRGEEVWGWTYSPIRRSRICRRLQTEMAFLFPAAGAIG